jgi:hypothetical protein
MYARSSGQYGTHGWQARCVSVGRLSYIAVQVYDQLHQRRFRSVFGLRGRYDLVTFALLPATGILHVLDQPVSLVGGDRNLDIHEQDYATFRELRSHVLRIQPALLAAAKRTKGKGGETDEE